MFKSQLHVARDITARHKWIVTKPLVWDDSEHLITVPIGFEFDFASVPWLFQRLIPKSGGLYDRASCLHDYLYVSHITTRKQADDLFLKAMLSDGVKKWRAYSMYWAVRVGGSSAWKSNNVG